FKGLSFNLHMKDEFVKPLETMLKFFQTGINKIRKDKIKIEQLTDIDIRNIEKIQKELKPRKAIFLTSRDGKANYTFQLDLNEKLQVFKLRTEHQRIDNVPVIFEMSEESDGSLRMIDFIPALIDMTHNPSVYVVDEIDRSLHPMLTYKLYEYYFNKLCNNRDTQLICTTHESNLLDLNLFRSDEVCFVEKDKNGSSHITSLIDYKPRPDVNLKSGYLLGRYGAIPFFGNLNDLHW
nr:AAA family ATPase [Spirochaetota bacterium]